MKLNLACGSVPYVGFLGVDRVKTHCTDIVHDLNVYPWPFESESVETVVVRHYIEHIPLDTPEGDGLILFMNEMHRIMKVGGVAYIAAPYWTAMACWQDPTHRRAISENTFGYFNAGFRKDYGVEHYPITTNFETEIELALNEGYTLDDAKRGAVGAVFELRAVMVKK